MSAVVFIHGGGDNAYVEDKKIVGRLQEKLGSATPVIFPHLEALEYLDWPKTATAITITLRDLPQPLIVVAHSIGASAMVKLISENIVALYDLFLLAAPYNGVDGRWGKSEFGFERDFAKHLPKDIPITLYHCEDDRTIAVADVHRYAQNLPAAQIVVLKAGGHQFRGALTPLADAIRGVTR